MLRVADLFAGCGGSSQGVVDAGHQVVCAIEWDPYARSAYDLNFPTHGLVDLDLGDVERVVAHLEPLQLDCIVLSPPCQSHSSANKKADNTDARACLTEKGVEIVCAVRPRYFVLENVPRMLSSAVWKRCESKLMAAGYVFHAQSLNFAKMGVPQRRRRAVVAGCLEAAPVERYAAAVKTLKHTPEMTIQDVWPGTKHVWHCSRSNHSASITAGDRPYQTVRGIYFVPKCGLKDHAYKGPGPPKDSAPHDSPDVRVFSLDEIARIQGLERHRWPIKLSKTRKKKCIGNAVPPPAMAWILRHLII